MPLEQHNVFAKSFADQVAAYVNDQAKEFRPAGQWLDEHYSGEACWQREREEVKERNKNRPRGVVAEKPRAKRIITSGFYRLLSATEDVLNQAEDWEELRAETRKELSYKVILLHRLITYPDADTASLGLTELEQLDWAERSQIQHQKVPIPLDRRGAKHVVRTWMTNWHDVVLRAWHERARNEIVNVDLSPLSKLAATVYEILLELPTHRGLTGTELLDKLNEREITIDQSTLTKRLVPELKPYGIANKPRIGYFIPPSRRLSNDPGLAK